MESLILEIRRNQDCWRVFLLTFYDTVDIVFRLLRDYLLSFRSILVAVE